MPLSVDTTKPAVAEAALDAGADAINDIWGVGPDDALARLAAARGVPLIVMHNRAEPRYDGRRRRGRRRPAGRASSAPLAAGVARARSDRRPGHRLRQDARARTSRCCAGSAALPAAGPADPARHVAQVDARARCSTCRPISASRRRSRRPRSASRAGVDIVRVHDVQANVRAARMTDAVVRGLAGGSGPMSDRIVLATCASRRGHGVHERERATAQPFEVDVELELDLAPAGRSRRPRADRRLRRGLRRGRPQVVDGRPLQAARGARRGDRARAPRRVRAVDEVVVRVRKPEVRLGGPLDYAGVEIRRQRPAEAPEAGGLGVGGRVPSVT